MSLSNEERDIVVALHLEKSDRMLNEATFCVEHNMWSLAANRYYYACYHAVRALMTKHGYACKTHEGMIGLFGKHFVLTGKVEVRLGSFLNKMEQLRERADYNCAFEAEEEDVMKMKLPAEELIAVVKQLI